MLVKKEDKIDLENVLHMSEEQQEKFIEGCKEIFDEVKIKEIKEPEREGSASGESHEWTTEDYTILVKHFGEKSNKKIAEMMADEEGETRHTANAVNLQGGKFIQEFMDWYSRKYGGGLGDIEEGKKLVEEFQEEKGGE